MIRAFTIAPDGTGYELEDRISGLAFSNVLPGGDEQATFSFHSPWREPNEEIARFNRLVICDGVDVLWQGRIEELANSAAEDETIAVTAYGLGGVLKDSTVREVWIDRDLSRWQDPGIDRRDAVGALSGIFSNTSRSIGGYDSGDTTGLVQDFGELVTGGIDWNEAWYHGQGAEIGQVRYDFDAVGIGGTSTADWNTIMNVCDDDLGTTTVAGTDHNATDAAEQTVTADEPALYAYLYALYTGATTGPGTGGPIEFRWENIRVIGNHGVATVGEDPDEGLPASGIVAKIVADGSSQEFPLSPRRIDATAYAIRQLVQIDVDRQQAIEEVNAYHAHERAWGTWGPDSVLAPTGVGYFDYAQVERDRQHWISGRDGFEDLSFASETASLFNRVTVRYQDEVGTARTAEATGSVPELGAMVRTQTIDGGTLTSAEAAALASTYLALFGGFSPARGSATRTKPIRHYQRGEIPAHYMRADGSNVRIPDVLPTTTLLRLDTTPDRRTTFPIKRVSVDCSTTPPRVAIDVDQSLDLLSVIQAREAAAAALVGG